MRTTIALCALLALAAGFARAADTHPPVGTVVVACDNGKSYVHVGNGHFRELGAAAPSAKLPGCVCGEACTCPPGACPAKCPVTSGDDALAEVNAKRAARGLPPFRHDPLLTRAAEACASFRAQHRLFGHTANDFAFVPPGARADAAGCAAYEANYGWMSCCVYDSYSHAGAAWVTGADGKRYMHLFVSNGGAAIPATAPTYLPASIAPACPNCANGSCPAPTPARRPRYAIPVK